MRASLLSFLLLGVLASTSARYFRQNRRAETAEDSHRPDWKMDDGFGKPINTERDNRAQGPDRRGRRNGPQVDEPYRGPPGAPGSNRYPRPPPGTHNDPSGPTQYPPAPGGGPRYRYGPGRRPHGPGDRIAVDPVHPQRPGGKNDRHTRPGSRPSNEYIDEDFVQLPAGENFEGDVDFGQEPGIMQPIEIKDHVDTGYDHPPPNQNRVDQGYEHLPPIENPIIRYPVNKRLVDPKYGRPGPPAGLLGGARPVDPQYGVTPPVDPKYGVTPPVDPLYGVPAPNKRLVDEKYGQKAPPPGLLGGGLVDSGYNQDTRVDPQYGVQPKKRLIDPQYGVTPPVDPEYGVTPPMDPGFGQPVNRRRSMRRRWGY